MKLFQYRIKEDSDILFKSVAEFLKKSFEESLDSSVVSISFKNGEGFTRKKMNFDEIEEGMYLSIKNSFRKYSNIESCISIKSLSSCRFIVFEDDGLIRVCFGMECNPNIMDSKMIFPEDVSCLLVETDLFDYI